MLPNPQETVKKSLMENFIFFQVFISVGSASKKIPKIKCKKESYDLKKSIKMELYQYTLHSMRVLVINVLNMKTIYKRKKSSTLFKSIMLTVFPVKSAGPQRTAALQ